MTEVLHYPPFPKTSLQPGHNPNPSANQWNTEIPLALSLLDGPTWGLCCSFGLKVSSCLRSLSGCLRFGLAGGLGIGLCVGRDGMAIAAALLRRATRLSPAPDSRQSQGFAVPEDEEACSASHAASKSTVLDAEAAAASSSASSCSHSRFREV